MPREEKLARTLVELADTLVADFDVVELLTLLADRCVEVLDVEAAGLMLVAPEGDLRVMASSSEAMRVLELFELQAQEGPCLDCYRTGEPVVNQDLATVDGRWPRFAAEALAAGFHSVHALPMRLRGVVIGALNLFSVEPGRCARPTSTPPRRWPTSPRSPSSSTAPRSRPRSSTSSSTMRSTAASSSSRPREWSPSGKGLNMEQAFATLRNHARNHNLRLVDVARDVITVQAAGVRARSSAARDGPFLNSLGQGTSEHARRVAKRNYERGLPVRDHLR